VELVITIAIFGLMAGVLMRFFVISGSAENFAYEVQSMERIGQSVIENFKHVDSVGALINTINGGTNIQHIEGETNDTITAYFNDSWSYVAAGNEAARYKMTVVINDPGTSVGGVGSDVDGFEAEFNDAGTVDLYADATGTAYILSTNLASDTRAIDFNIDKVTLYLKLVSDTAGTVIINNQLNTQSTIPNYNAFSDDSLTVVVMRVEGNSTNFDITGNVNMIETTLETEATSGVYTMTITFEDIKSSELLLTQTSKKYGGM
jgi:hypothetical protein